MTIFWTELLNDKRKRGRMKEVYGYFLDFTLKICSKLLEYFFKFLLNIFE